MNENPILSHYIRTCPLNHEFDLLLLQILAVASCANVSISTVELLPTESFPEHKDVSSRSLGGPPSKGLVLSIGPDFQITMSSSMIRFIASLAPAQELLGRNQHETAQIDSWLSFLWHSIELPLYILTETESLCDNGKAESSKTVDVVHSQLKASLAIIETHLIQRDDDQQLPYLVGTCISVADIAFATVLKYHGMLLKTALIVIQDSYLDRWLGRIEHE